MAKYASMVKETTTTTGTGNLTLAGGVTGFRALSDVFTPNADDYLADYVAYFLTASDGTWERGYGKFVSATQLNRTFVMESTNSDAAIVLPTGEHTVSVAPNPDMGQKRGIELYDPTQASAADGGIVQVEWDDEAWDSDGVITTPITFIPIPLWVDKIRVAAQFAVTSGSTTNGSRQLWIGNHSGDRRSMPRLNVPSGATFGAKKITICSGLVDIGQETSATSREIYLSFYHDSGSSLSIDGPNTWLNVEFVQ